MRRVLFADGTSYDYDYDARGNRTLEKSPTHERGLSYDALGRLERVEDRTLGRTITYGYDAAGNRTKMELDTGEMVQYRWDALGRLDTLIDPQGESTRFQYDAAGRRQRADYGNRTSASYAYDAAGQVLSIVYANPAGEVLTAFGYEYDVKPGPRVVRGDRDRRGILRTEHAVPEGRTEGGSRGPWPSRHPAYRTRRSDGCRRGLRAAEDEGPRPGPRVVLKLPSVGVSGMARPPGCRAMGADSEWGDR